MDSSVDWLSALHGKLPTSPCSNSGLLQACDAQRVAVMDARGAQTQAAAIATVQRREGRNASDREVAEELGVTMEVYNAMLLDTSNGKILEMDEFETGIDGRVELSHHEGNPYDDMAKQRFQSALSAHIKTLPEREALVLSLYYDEELNLKEIGQILDVSESRVSQIHSQAMHRLRAKLQVWQG